MELLFSLFLLAGILGMPLFFLVSGGIALSRGRGGWGRIVVGALWLGLVGLGCLAVGGGGPPGFLVALAVIFVALLSVVPLGLLVSGIVAAANRRGGRGRIAVAAVWFAAAAAGWLRTALVTWDTKEAFRYPELRGEWTYQYQTNDDLAVISVRWQPPDDRGFPGGHGFWEDSYWWDAVSFNSPGFGVLRADRGDSRHREIEELILDEAWNYP